MERKTFLPFLPRLNQCCCCVELRTGVIVLGLLQFLGCLSDLLKMAMYNDSNMKVSLGSMMPESDDEANDYVSNYRASATSSHLIGLVLALLLLIGAVTRRVLLLKIYVIVQFLCVIILSIMTIIIIFFVPVLGVLLGLITGILVYYLLCVNAYLQELLDEEYSASGTVEFKPV